MSRQKEVFVKVDSCLGCKSCVLACAVEHSESKTLYGAAFEKPLSKSRVYVEWVAPDKSAPILCRHCEDAPCALACIAGALTRNDEGVVITDDAKCIGCWTCVMVCPYGAIGRLAKDRKAYRCDRCPDAQEPACVNACPTKALIYKSVEEYSRDARQEAARELASLAKQE